MFIPHFSKSVIAGSLMCAVSFASAFSLADVSNKDATSGVKAALEKSATTAVGKLGVENGFLNNDKVKIGMPASVEKVMLLLRMTGQGKKIDEL